MMITIKKQNDDNFDLENFYFIFLNSMFANNKERKKIQCQNIA